jgi:hypothetical protein
MSCHRHSSISNHVLLYAPLDLIAIVIDIFIESGYPMQAAGRVSSWTCKYTKRASLGEKQPTSDLSFDPRSSFQRAYMRCFIKGTHQPCQIIRASTVLCLCRHIAMHDCNFYYEDKQYLVTGMIQRLFATRVAYIYVGGQTTTHVSHSQHKLASGIVVRPLLTPAFFNLVETSYDAG